MKTIERAQARQLRRVEGLPIKEIARRLGVSQSSVSVWVRDIELTAEQHATLRMMNPAYNRQIAGRNQYAQKCRCVRQQCQDEGRRVAQQREPLHIAGCMLYWAEGTKDRNHVRLSNSDPEVVRLFVKFLRAYFEVDDADICVTCHLFADHVERQREIEQFWLDTLDLPQSSLRRSVVNVYSKHSQKKRKNKLPYGTCRVAVSRTSIVQHIFGAIQEYGGFSREAWLG